jgi:hypothetical protein
VWEAVVLGFAFVTRARGADPPTMTLVDLPNLPKPAAVLPVAGGN